MNAMVVDEKTGFLTAPNFNAFDAEKKVKFLQLAQDSVQKQNRWPDLGKLCDAIGIDPRTLDRHLSIDPAFKEAYGNITLRGKWNLESLMFELSGKNPMYLFGWLRKHYPAEYNPDHKVSIQHDITMINGLESGAQRIIETNLL